jgi:hypothetical protein
LNDIKLKEQRRQTLNTRLGKLQGSYNELQEQIVLQAMTGLTIEQLPAEETVQNVEIENKGETKPRVPQKVRRTGGRGGRGGRGVRGGNNRGTKANGPKSDRQKLPEGLQQILNNEDVKSAQLALADVKAIRSELNASTEEAKQACRLRLREAQKRKQETFNRVLATQKQQVSQAQKNVREAKTSKDEERLSAAQRALREARSELRQAKSQLNSK